MKLETLLINKKINEGDNIKIIFLDIDGVLNTPETFIRKKQANDKTIEIDHFRLEYLQEIIEKTNAKIVLSATMRNEWIKYKNSLFPITQKSIELESLFKQYNLKIYDITGKDLNRNRGNEINNWLLNHSDIETFVVIDDETSDMDSISDEYIVKTRENKKAIGLSQKHIDKIIQILKKTNQKVKKIN